MNEALNVIAGIWNRAEDQVQDGFLSLAAEWRAWLMADPSRAGQPLPHLDELQNIITTGVLNAAGSALEVTALEAGISSVPPGVFSLLGDYYSQYGGYVQTLDQGMQAAVQVGLQNAANAGLSEEDTALHVLGRMLPLGAARLKTIARTELTNATTLGRVATFHAAGVRLYEYRSVLDPDTTRTCTHLDGMVLDPRSALARQLMPANHYRCRALVVPAAEDAAPATEAQLLEGIRIRREEFPGWQPRLGPYLEQVVA
ncbi:minor capsid protein [Deinococcus kurensis]|uniref:minor capsid protein n=1 Tax=Deinococcus kurensis TaxID=2662757 RepID=UPI0012D2E026|nr:minor capsid protein [Deinococcus kurensis]